MVKVQAKCASASNAEGAMVGSIDAKEEGPSTHPDNRQDMYPTGPSLCSGGRNYGMFSEGASNAPYAGCKLVEDTKPRVGGGDGTQMGGGEAEDEDISPSDELAQLMMQEVATYRKGVKRGRRCMLCPFREFQGPCRVRNHILNYHVRRNTWCASGRKQLRVCIALFDNDSFATPVGDAFNPQPNYLRRSAALIREQVLTASPGASGEMASINMIDKMVRLVQYAEGPEFRHVDFIRRERNMFRALGYSFYSESFYDAVYRLATEEQGRVGKIQAIMQSKCRGELGSLQPKFIHVWEAILFDIFYSDGVCARISKLLDICRSHGEFESVTVDCTVKPTLPLLGQANHNVARSKKKSQAVPYAEQYHSVLIVRGSCGSALLVEPMFSENILATAAVYVNKFTVEQRNSVLFMSTDKTSGLLVATMRQVFPRLRGCALDPVHLAMAVEQPTWEKRNKLSNKLRCVIRKFAPSERGLAADSQFYDGAEVVQSSDEARAQKAISTEGRSQQYAMNQLASISPERGFDSRGEFCRYLAHLAAAYPDISRKKGRTSRTIRQLLKSACDPGTIEWYLNNERMRRQVSRRLLPYIAVGTTGSEAINAELKTWFRGVFQLHGPILKLKLRIFQVAKLVAFSAAMYKKTTHQMTQQYVLSRCTKESGLFESSEEWEDWCRRTNSDQVPPSRHFMVDREVFASRLAKWKKAESKKPRTHTIKILLKRTPYRQYKGPRPRFAGALGIPRK